MIKTTWLGLQLGSGTNGKVFDVVLKLDLVPSANAQLINEMESAICMVGRVLDHGPRLAFKMGGWMDRLNNLVA